jgi:CDP-2,3-bis-(O-geranylgeranyl)-sn-glycerol synthase
VSASDPLACALAIVAAMSLAGLAHACWMASRHSAAFRIPIDGGRQWRGARIFGDHKTFAGFMAIIPAAGAGFALLGALRDALPAWLDAGLWLLAPGQLFALGCWAGFWFMAGELPNSFLKRRIGLAPGAIPVSGWRRRLCLVLDRIDSVLALLLALDVLVPMHWATWLWVLAIGPAVHLVFSSALFLTGVKARAA